MKTSRALTVAGLALCLMLGCIQEPDNSKSVGQKGVLSSVNEYMPVAVTEAAFDELTKARAAKDKAGQMQLLTSGKTFMVKSGTKVLVIDSTFAKRKIRILEGEHGGKAGWVGVERVK